MHSVGGNGVVRLTGWYDTDVDDLWSTLTDLRRLRVTMSDEEAPEDVLTAELVADGDHAVLNIEMGGLPLDTLYAYAAGEQTLMEALGAHLARRGCADWQTRWGELAPSYHEIRVVPLER